MNEVVLSDGCEGGSEEHDFVVRMRSHEEQVVLPNDLPVSLVEVDHSEGKEIEAEQDVLEGEVHSGKQFLHSHQYHHQHHPRPSIADYRHTTSISRAGKRPLHHVPCDH